MRIYEIIRFIIVGFTNTLNYYLLYLGMTALLSFHYMAAHLTAFFISMIGSFYMNCYFTYRTKPTLRKFFQFPLTYVVNISVSTSAIYILVDVMAMNDKLAPLLAAATAIPFTFLVSRKILKVESK